MRNCARIALAAICAVIVGLVSARADDYPSAPIHLISGFPPGSTADISARVVGARMGQILGQQFVIENRVGAGSSLAAAQVARAAKDGYTLYVGNAANVINAAMSSNLNFDFYKDFEPVALITSTPTVLAVTPELGVQNVKQLIALAKAKPGELSFGSSGVGSSTHLALELFNRLAQVKITHIPYSGSPQVITDMLANRVQGYFSPASTVMGHIQAGKLVGLAITDPKRSSILPELPTMIEAGVPDFESVLWFGIDAPAGTPQPIVDKLARAANEALKSDEIVNSLKSQTIATLGGTPEEFRKHLESERKRWTAVVEGAGLRK
ncbi:Bug family tripartite tricarboxylate transporter substrate binding protein [Rhodoplanes sp. Z2-YC6860]|uniref:Bug family tripartite tricarboxylate transporter substrate binding protein n=1 Tax=Rhodoplanes sp. Z2-YC6860 TaxID=674703 RepID=UPI000B1F4762|nr:tripartite tricarboxylate transporter substrate-binding protein [Rhodoplanes sp. Z2-YC6860]